MSDVRRVGLVYEFSDCGWDTDGPVTANKVFPHPEGSHALMPWEEYERLRAEVERLRASNDFLRHCTQGFVFISEHGEMETWVCAECRGKNWREEHGIWITDEQIDAAWSFTDSTQGSDVADARALGAYRALRSVGIVACPECRGSGVYTAWDFHPNEEPHHGQTCSACERCNGHGWIREEHGDE